MSQVSLVTISLAAPFPESGMAPVIVRVTGHDKAMIALAAAHMRISKSQLMRILLVRGSERVLNELGVQVVYEQDEHVDLSRGETLID